MVFKRQNLNYPQNLCLRHRTQIRSHLRLYEKVEGLRPLKLHPKVGTINNNIQELNKRLQNKNLLLDMGGRQPIVNYSDEQIDQ